MRLLLTNIIVMAVLLVIVIFYYLKNIMDLAGSELLYKTYLVSSCAISLMILANVTVYWFLKK